MSENIQELRIQVNEIQHKKWGIKIMIAKIIGEGIASLFSNYFEYKKVKTETKIALARQKVQVEGDYDSQALQQMQFSWKDEFITLILFSPLAVAWIDTPRAMEWVGFVEELPLFYQALLFGIVASTFGLRWYFKQRGMKILETKK